MNSLLSAVVPQNATMQRQDVQQPSNPTVIAGELTADALLSMSTMIIIRLAVPVPDAELIHFILQKKIRVMTFIQCMHAAPAVFMPQVLMYMFPVPGKNRKTFILSAR